VVVCAVELADPESHPNDPAGHKGSRDAGHRDDLHVHGHSPPRKDRSTDLAPNSHASATDMKIRGSDGRA
jgi:hypothetical protein